MTCPICNGSGDRDGEYGLLSCDAPNCTAATERAALEAANKAAEPMTVYDQRWFAYCAGKAAANASVDIRAKFEDYFSDDGLSPKAIEKNSGGHYRLMQAASAWRTWEACCEIMGIK